MFFVKYAYPRQTSRAERLIYFFKIKFYVKDVLTDFIYPFTVLNNAYAYISSLISDIIEHINTNLL